MTLEELRVVITAETSELRTQLNSVQSQVSNMTKSVTKNTGVMSSAFKSLFKGFSFVAITAGLVKFAKTAINTASDIAEVQNVVDVAFGSMADEVNDFASTAIKRLGMSELAAKQYSSTFMAMSNGMGVAAKSGKNMAIELTKLTGDMASFYNVEQSVAATALKSVYTGETETLKKFGVVMTEANLEAYALSQGIKKSYKEMSQAEKVALRYNFVLSSTRNAQGDFARTSDSWANQIRILKEQFNQLAGIIGNGLVKALKPAVQAMNQLLSAAISVAQAMASAFGWTEKLTGISTSVESGASSMEDLASATDDASKSANKLTDISGFDELNTVSSKSGASAAGDIADMAITTAESTAEMEEQLDNSKSKFQEYVSNVKDIFKNWFKDIPKLEIQFDKEKALENLKNIGLNIANVIAGWGSFVITLGIEILNDLDIGGIANKFLQLVESATRLASEITNVLVPAFKDFYDTALKPVVKWLGEKLKEALDFGAELLDDFADWFRDNCPEIQALIHSIAEAFSAAWDLIRPILDFIINTIKKNVKAIVDIVKDALSAILPVLTNLMDALTGLLKFIKGVFTGDWKKAWEGLKQIVVSVFDGIKNAIKGAINIIISFVNKLISGINKIKLPNWDILGKAAGKGINIPLIPKLANGGVLSTPTVAMLGEYPGARTNPEIATPQKLLESIIANNNGELVAAWAQMTRQLISAIENVNMNVSIGDDVIASSAARGNNKYFRMTGKPLFATN